MKSSFRKRCGRNSCNATRCYRLGCAWNENRSEADRLAQSVDKGEAEAIELAKELRADWLLIDGRKGRRLAAKEGVPVIGWLGIVILAKRRGFLESARAILDQLEREAGIFISPTVKNDGLRTIGE